MDELLKEVRAARRAAAEGKKRRERIHGLLVQVRRENPGLTIADLEARIDRFYDRATISRITHPLLKDAAPVQD